MRIGTFQVDVGVRFWIVLLARRSAAVEVTERVKLVPFGIEFMKLCAWSPSSTSGPDCLVEALAFAFLDLEPCGDLRNLAALASLLLTRAKRGSWFSRLWPFATVWPLPAAWTFRLE